MFHALQPASSSLLTPCSTWLVDADLLHSPSPPRTTPPFLSDRHASLQFVSIMASNVV